MAGKIDLHMHTTHSDGFYSPSEIVIKAKEVGLDAISITDHDSTNGIEEATSVGKELGIEVTPGVEISSEHNGKEVHILGYFFDYTNKEFARYLSFFREERIKRAERIIKKLENLGLYLAFEDIMGYLVSQQAAHTALCQGKEVPEEFMIHILSANNPWQELGRT